MDVFIPLKHQAAPTVQPGQHYEKQSSQHLLLPTTNLGDLLTTEKSAIHGLGLYAQVPVQMHQTIWHESLTRQHPQDDGPLKWTNHSDSPNATLLLQQTELYLVALREIPFGEEITYNYNFFGHRGYGATCNCGEPGCQGIFTLRNDWGEKR